jgi:hypothetical protein
MPTLSRWVLTNGLSINTKNASFTDAKGIAHAYTSGHIQTWGGTSGFAQPLGNGWAFDFYGQPATGGTYSGLWAAYWALGSDNSWPGTGTGGGELDVAEFAGYSCTATLYDFNTYGAGGRQGLISPSGAFVGTDRQFTATNIGGTGTWYLDGSSVGSAGGWGPTDPFFPIVDVEYPSNCGGNGSNLPLTTMARYVRVYSRVTSGACYTSIPARGTIPHTGTC